MNTLSFKKLNDGSWGLVAGSALTVGSVVKVAKRDGSTSTVRVGMYVTAITDGETERWYYRISARPVVEAPAPVKVAATGCALDRGEYRCGGCDRHYFGMGRGGYAGD